MALVNCKECGGSVSSSAGKCPHCGRRLRSHPIVILIAVGCGIYVLYSLLSSHAGLKEADQKVREAEQELQRVVQAQKVMDAEQEPQRAVQAPSKVAEPRGRQGGELSTANGVRPAETRIAPPDAVPFQGHWYKAFYHRESRLSWYRAKEECERMGGCLACIKSAEENEFVRSILNGRSVYWLGATDEEREGRWVWVTGQALAYANWAPGQPDNANGAEHYLAAGTDGRWYDNLIVHGADAYVCEWGVEP